MVETKRREKFEYSKKRKRAKQLLKLLHLTPPSKQSKLRLSTPILADDVVDEAWGTAFFGLDIAVNKIENPLFREAIIATKQSKRG